jgi:hypothetical protein
MHARARECGWNGIEGTTDHVGPCGKPAVGCVEDAAGRRQYTCEEHISHARALLPTGVYHAGVLADDQEAPFTPHGASRQARHNASTVGHFE